MIRGISWAEELEIAESGLLPRRSKVEPIPPPSLINANKQGICWQPLVLLANLSHKLDPKKGGGENQTETISLVA